MPTTAKTARANAVSRRHAALGPLPGGCRREREGATAHNMTTITWATTTVRATRPTRTAMSSAAPRVKTAPKSRLLSGRSS